MSFFPEFLKPGDRVYIEPKGEYPFLGYVTEIHDDGSYTVARHLTQEITLATHLKEQT